MFPLILKVMCAHKFSFVQHFTWTHLNLEWRVWSMCKSIFGTNFYVRSKFFVRSSHDLCARAFVENDVIETTSVSYGIALQIKESDWLAPW